MTTAEDRLTTQLSSLHLRWRWNTESRTGVGEAAQNVWNRAYRRELSRKQKSGEEVILLKGTDNMAVKLAFRIVLLEGLERMVTIDWLRGTDKLLWESFCGMVRKTVLEP
jgi:23S rRNA (adenine1618-N6)-methyltransferase